ncbi:MAG: LPS export ABC transporter ATP-binding protein [Planctomycetota bacterium]|nr:LPS export ABC transporter ATP-binding protein [Planctomycetota bacterium]
MGLFQAHHLTKIYRRRKVVNDVTFHVDPGEIVGLLGPNGAGKTTVFKMAMGMVRPDGGSVELGGTDVTRFPMYKRARQGMGYLSQEPSVFRRLTTVQNLLAIAETLPLSRKDRTARIENLLETLELGSLRNNRAETLSGGERRRLEIARSLLTEPSILLLDEPFAGVDPIAVADIQDIVRNLRRRGISILLTDHNVRETLAITDRSYIIFEGRILRHGPADDLVNDPLVRQVYLGEKFSMPELRKGGEDAADPPSPLAPMTE